MATNEFNRAANMGWQAYGAVSGFTGGIGIGVVALALYMKPDAPGWWLALSIAGFLGAAGSIVSLVAILKQDMKDKNQQPGNDPAAGNGSDDPPAPGP